MDNNANYVRKNKEHNRNVRSSQTARHATLRHGKDLSVVTKLVPSKRQNLDRTTLYRDTEGDNENIQRLNTFISHYLHAVPNTDGTDCPNSHPQNFEQQHSTTTKIN